MLNTKVVPHTCPLFVPDRASLVSESPCADHAHGFHEFWRRSPEKKNGVIGCDIRDWQSADFINRHGWIVILHLPRVDTHKIVEPWRIGVDQWEASDIIQRRSDFRDPIFS